MRVLLLALAVALTAAYQTNFVPKFDIGHTYVYKYEAFITSGLREPGLARAGVKVRSKVLISAQFGDTYFLKLEETEILEYSDTWPKGKYIPATKLTSALHDQLFTPIKFEYSNGVVGKVYAPASVSATVLNIYRGILNIFQLNLKRTHNIYDLQEAGVQGICKTHYIITDDARTERIKVDKLRDLNHCQERIMKDIGLVYTEKCVECQAKGQAMMGTATFSYNIQASPARILEATSTEINQFAPFRDLSGGTQMETKQYLAFVEVRSAAVLPARIVYLHRGSLEYEFGSELVQTPIQLLKISNAEAQIVDTLNHLVTNNQDKVHEDAPLKFIELLQLFRVVEISVIESLWSRFESKQHYRHWILEAIPAIGTHTALRFIKEKFVTGKIEIIEAAPVLVSTMHMVTADREVITLVEGLIKEDKIQKIPVLRDIVMLGYGTLIAKYCAQNPTCPAEFVLPLREALNKAIMDSDFEMLITALKALGNAGHPASIKPIMKLLPGFGNTCALLSHRVLVETILVLRNFAKKEPKMIQQIAIQLFHRDMHPELRMAAAMVLFETKLPMGLVTYLANIVMREKNLQVTSFVYTYMKSMTKNTAPDYASVAAACHVALKMLRPRFDRMSYRYSRAFYFSAYHNPWMMGAAASAFYINDAATLLPRTVVAKARTYLAGAYADVLEFGVRGQGVQEAFMKVRDNNKSTRIERIKQVLKALSDWRDNGNDQPLASVYVKFFGQEVAFANLDKAIIDQVIETANGPVIHAYAKKALNALLQGVSTHYVKALLVAEVRRIIPTSIGLPMELSFYTAAVAAASAKFRAKATPPVPTPYRASHLMHSRIEMQATFIPSFTMHTYAVMGVNTGLIQAALQYRGRVHTSVPAVINAIFDFSNGSFKVEFLPTDGGSRILSANVETLAVVRNVKELSAAKITPVVPKISAEELSEGFVSKSSSSSADDMSSSSELILADVPVSPEKRKAIISYFEKTVCASIGTFGFSLCTAIKSHNAAYLRDSILYRIAGEHEFLVEFIQDAGPRLEKIEIDVQFGPKAADKIVKVTNQSEEEEILEDKNVLMKLKKILIPGLKNNTTSSSSSSSKDTSSSGTSSNSNSSTNKKSSMSNKSSQYSSSSSSSNSDADSSKESSHSSSYSSPSFNIRSKHTVSTTRDKKKSSSSSFEEIYREAKHLADILPPIATILIHAVRNDNILRGYQITAYIKEDDKRVEFVVENLSAKQHWRICADGMMRHNKLKVWFSWGIKCSQCRTEIAAVMRRDPVPNLVVNWKKLPMFIREYDKKVTKYISHFSLGHGIGFSEVKNEQKQITLNMTVTYGNLLDLDFRTPRWEMFKNGIKIPIELLRDTATELQTYQGNWGDKILYMITKPHTAECTLAQDTVITFNNWQFRNEMPHSCYQVLAQDCTLEHKFIVLLKRDQTQEQNHISMMIADIDVDMYPKDNAIVVMVNGVQIPINNLPYQHPEGQIQIRQRGPGITLHAPAHGLQEVFMDLNALKVKVMDWMRGQTCGLCGQADGEIRQEYRTPNKRIAKNAVSFAHSWVVPATTCQNADKCYMKVESVKLDRQISLNGQDSKCYSVEPVLRCLPECTPVRTTTVNVGFHCVPADSNMNRSESLGSIFQKSIDLRESAEAHLACRCSPQCA